MSEKLNLKDDWNLIGYVKISKNRYNVLKTLETRYLMPSEIAKKTGLKPTQVSKTLNTLKKQNLVECKNEESYKGRIYSSTPLGKEIIEFIDKNR